MNKRNFGRSGITVSELCFGTMNFGWTIDRENAFALLDRYHAAGGYFLQAVHVSSDLPLLPITFRAPEEWIGEWFRSRSIPREELVISSRISLHDAGRSGREPLGKRLQYACESSLKRFGVDSLDLLICEWSKSFLPADNALEAFRSLVDSGHVRQIAIANVPLWRVMEAIAREKTGGQRHFEGVQMEYSLLSWPEAREEAQELCGNYELGLLVTSALGGAAAGLRRQTSQKQLPPAAVEHGRTLERVRREAPEGAQVEQLALAWVLSQPQVTSVVISANSSNQLQELLEAASWGIGRT